MTAEIAILNRSAIALAADSAVTISVGNKNKVYDTAEKLFELSQTQPLALMIYNNVEFVGVPLDVLIRKFRNEHANLTRFDSMSEVSDLFIEYLQGFKHSVDEEKQYLFSIVQDEFKQINELHSRRMRKELLAYARDPSNPLPDTEAILLKMLNRASDRKKDRPLSGYLTRVSLARFKARFGDVLEQAFKSVFKAVDATEELLKSALQFGFHSMKCRDGSDLLTGLVFGGFAETDMFPTLRYLEVDGAFFDTVKVLAVNEVDIDREKKRAEVVPFAQKEMVERFMYGLDTELGESLDKFVRSAVDEVIEAVGASAEETLKSAIREKVCSRFSTMTEKLRDSSRQDLIDIVYFMSKKELADIAYALVELTSHKRRFSTDEQTVGGPIDVAILTKSEGLVWIRRKHYFNADVNQAYLARVQSSRGGDDGSKKATVKQEAG